MADLPEYLTDQTYESILQRMKERVPPQYDRSEGSFIHDALSPAAAELAQAAIWAQEVLRRGFLQTTFGPYLDLAAAEYGISRKPAVKATGQVTFSGTPGAVIPAGTQVSTVGSHSAPAVFFVTTQEVTIGASGTATADIEAVEAGIGGNVATSTIKILIPSISGVASVINEQPTTGGTDEETDESLRGRILERTRRPPDTGNKNDYIRWVKEVPGVGDAICIPLWNGPGTVKVVIVDSNGEPANETLIEAVQNYIDPEPGKGEGRAPIGAHVTVAAPGTVSIDVSATLSYRDGYDPSAVRTAVAEAVTKYINSLAIGEDVKYAAVVTAIYTTQGVENCSNVLVNGEVADVTITDEAKAVIGTVTLT